MRRRMMAPQLEGGALATRRITVQGVAHRVQDGALSRAGIAVDEEERMVAEIAEVEDLDIGIRTKCLDDEMDRPHASTSRSFRRRLFTTAANAATASELGAAPVTCS